jgi:hypothetical protein
MGKMKRFKANRGFIKMKRGENNNKNNNVLVWFYSVERNDLKIILIISHFFGIF